MGNGESMNMLLGSFENHNGLTPDFLSPHLAYKYGRHAIMCGMNLFKRMINLFNKHFDELYYIFAKLRGIDLTKIKKLKLKDWHKEHIKQME